MTAQIIPFAGMKDLDPALMQMVKDIAALKAAQKTQQEQAKQNSWRNLTQEPPKKNNESLLGMVFAMAFLGDMMNLPSMLTGMSQLGLMNMSENNTSNSFAGLSQLNDDLGSSMQQMALMAPLFGGMSQDKGESASMMEIVMAYLILQEWMKHQEDSRGKGGSGAMAINHTADDILSRNLTHMQFIRAGQEKCGYNGRKKLFAEQKGHILPRNPGCTQKLAHN